jgi:hypothetical protein
VLWGPKETFPGVRLLSDTAKANQKFAGGRGYSAIAHCSTYNDQVTEMEIYLGKADGQSCSNAADQVHRFLFLVLQVAVSVL